MKQLEVEFIGKGQVKGFVFKQIANNGLAYIYEVTDDCGIHYEVFEHKEVEATSAILGGVSVMYEARVLYPKESAFGVWAKCVKHRSNAFYLYEQISNEVMKRKEKKKRKEEKNASRD